MSKSTTHFEIDQERAIDHLLDLMKVEGLSGREGAIAELVRAKLASAGCRDEWMQHDNVASQIPDDYEIGNLIVRIPGTVEGPPRLFAGHLDTVPLCQGARPVREGQRIVSAEETAVGADNRTAVALLVTLAETLLTQNLEHPSITLLFTVGEEVGLWGARFVDPVDLGHPVMGFNFDGELPEEITVGAVGADRWEVDIHGRASHAGVSPGEGISALLVASRAITDVAAQGYFGAITDNGREGTSNVGVLRGGQATNEVTPHAFVRGESRSFEAEFVDEITERYRQAFERAAASVTADDGTPARVEFRAETDYRSFRLADDEPVVEFARRVVESTGHEPILATATGGLDANYFVEHGIPTVTFGAGQHGPHTVEEYADLDEFLRACHLAVALATAE